MAAFALHTNSHLGDMQASVVVFGRYSVRSFDTKARNVVVAGDDRVVESSGVVAFCYCFFLFLIITF